MTNVQDMLQKPSSHVYPRQLSYICLASKLPITNILVTLWARQV